MKSYFSDIHAILSSASRIALFAHERPDGDAIGSVIAFSDMLASNFSNKHIDGFILDELPSVYAFIEGYEDIQTSLPTDFTAETYDLVCFLDIGSFHRSKIPDNILSGLTETTKVVNIDHHNSSDQDAHLHLVDTSAASTTEIIYELARYHDWQISPRSAHAMLVGIYTDTGGFLHRNVTQQSFEISASLVALGADPGEIAEKIYKSNSVAFVSQVGELLSRVRVFGGVSFCSFFGYENSSEGLRETITSWVTSIEDIRWSCVLSQDDEFVRGSLRTKRGDIDVSAMARKLGGGGHQKAAGLKFSGELLRTQEGEDYIERDGEKISVEEFLMTLEK